MSAQFRPEAVPPRRAMPRSLSSLVLAARPAGQGEAAFEAWLRRELGRVYGATMAAPVPDALARLLKPHLAEADAGTPGATPT